MKKIYESFMEIANDFVDGEHWTHQLSKHTEDECFAWQHGVKEFAAWLDQCGTKIIENPEIYPTLWGNLMGFNYKHGNNVECSVEQPS